MSKNYKRLHVFGDSYSTPNYCVTPEHSYWGLAAQSLEIDTVANYSWPGNSVTSIFHTLISLQTTFSWETDYFLIGIPPLERLTVFDNYKDTQYNFKQFDTNSWHETLHKLNCHTGLQNIPTWQADKLVLYSDRSWTETEVLGKLFLLTSWLDSKQANYLVVNLSKPFDQNNVWAPTEFLLEWAIEHNKMCLFENTYYSVNENINQPVDFDTHGWFGHHGPAGNKHFFEKTLKNKLC